jgi:hypothetical protein
MAFATFVAIACAALLSANEWWTAFLSIASIAALLVAVLAAVYLRGPGRAFWFGFALFGWVYVVILFWPDRTEPGVFPHEALVDQLPTTRVLQYAYEHHPRRPPADSPGSTGFFAVSPEPSSDSPGLVVQGMGGARPALRGAPGVSYVLVEDFFSVGHWLWAILLAWLGGLLARFFASRAQPATGTP